MSKYCFYRIRKQAYWDTIMLLVFWGRQKRKLGCFVRLWYVTRHSSSHLRYSALSRDLVSNFSCKLTQHHVSICLTSIYVQEVSSEWCAAHSEAMSPMDTPAPGAVSNVALLAICPLLVFAVAVAVLYWRYVHYFLWEISSSRSKISY